MQKKEYTIYEFNELSEASKKKAIDQCREFLVDDQWWEYIYEDAKTIGLEITGFDIDRGAYCEGEWLESPKEVIRLIKENHGKDCDTYKTAIEYEEIFSHWQIDEDGEIIEDEQNEDDFRNDLLEDYRVLLSKEYDYLTSNEAIIEFIESNEYMFTENGKLDK